MVEEPARDEIGYRALEWTLSIVRDWLAVNEEAQALQAQMPPAVREHLAQLPPGFAALAPAMSTTINPESLILAHAVLSSSKSQLRSLIDSGSLSHRVLRLVGNTEMEKMRAGVGDGLEARVEALEESLRRMNEKLSRIVELLEDEGSDRGSVR